MLTKPKLRQQLRQQRQALTPSQRRDAARKAARAALRLAAKARRVALYLSYGSEISTGPLLRQLLARGKKVHVPRLRGADMRMTVITSTSALRRNRFGIREPVSRRHCSARNMDLVFLPLLGFDAAGNRLGTGGGYYDRLLAGPRTFRRPLRVGYAYSIQQQPSLPHDPWDVRLDAVVTEKGIQRWRTG